MASTCIATTLEKRRLLPVDTLVSEPIFTSTHAITIDAPRERVWPWIAQMGAGRAGYSWDAIDNGGTPSATGILPNLQKVVTGDVMPSIPGAADTFVVAAVGPLRDLVLTVPDGRGGNAVAWEHVLDPLSGGRTRLLVRGRAPTRSPTAAIPFTTGTAWGVATIAGADVTLDVRGGQLDLTSLSLRGRRLPSVAPQPGAARLATT